MNSLDQMKQNGYPFEIQDDFNQSSFEENLPENQKFSGIDRSSLGFDRKMKINSDLKESYVSAHKQLSYNQRNENNTLDDKANLANYETYGLHPIISNFSLEKGVSLPLIKFNEFLRKFEYHEETLKEFVRYEGNISIVSIIGPTQTGKSFIFNKLLGLKQQKQFPVDKLRPTTKGLNIWSLPLYNEKENTYIFFMDCQGFTAYDSVDNYLFQLSVLLSSLAIVNTQGELCEKSLEQIAMLKQIDQNIVVENQEDPNDLVNLHEFLPKILWLLRDHKIKDKNKAGSTLDGKQYLENFLNADYSKSLKTQEFLQTIKKYFKDRDCVAVSVPVQKQKDLERLEQINDDQLKIEFINDLKLVQEKIIFSCSPKIFKREPMNSRMLCSQICCFIDSINQQEKVNFEITWLNILDNEFLNAVEESKDLYKQNIATYFDKDVPRNSKEIYTILKNLREFSIRRFFELTQIKNNPTTQEKYFAQLKEFIDNKEKMALKINEDIGDKICETIYEENFSIFEKELEENLLKKNSKIYEETQTDLLMKKLQDFVQLYKTQSIGSNKQEIFFEKFFGNQEQILKQIIKRFQQQAQIDRKQFEDQRKHLQEQSEDLANQNEEIAQSLQQFQENNELLTVQNEKLESEKRNLQQENAQIKKDSENFKQKAKNFEQVQKQLQEKEKEIELKNQELQMLKKKKKGCMG